MITELELGHGCSVWIEDLQWTFRSVKQTTFLPVLHTNIPSFNSQRNLLGGPGLGFVGFAFDIGLISFRNFCTSPQIFSARCARAGTQASLHIGCEAVARNGIQQQCAGRPINGRDLRGRNVPYREHPRAGRPRRSHAMPPAAWRRAAASSKREACWAPALPSSSCVSLFSARGCAHRSVNLSWAASTAASSRSRSTAGEE